MTIYQGNNLISGDTVPTQTGNSGKYLMTDGTNTMWNNPYRPPLFQPTWSDHLLNDIQWLRADNFSWQYGSVYETAYNELVSEYTDESSVTETSVVPWVQPTLSANGTLGSGTFSVGGGAIYSTTYDFYKAVSGNSADYWATSSGVSLENAYYIIYSSTPIILTGFSYRSNDGNYNASSLALYGSNDNSTYTLIQSYTGINTSLSSWSFIVNNSTAYNYYKIKCDGYNTYGFNMSSLELKASKYGLSCKRTPKQYKIIDVDNMSSPVYSTIGSPTISSSGIASGFSSSNSITMPMLDTSKSDWSIQLKFQYSVGTGQNALIGNPAGSTTRLAIIANTNRLMLFASTGASTSWDIANALSGSTILTEGINYVLTFSRVSGTSYVLKLKNLSTGVETIERTITSSAQIKNEPSVPIKLGSFGWTPFVGSIDLKYFSEKENGSEVYSAYNSMEIPLIEKYDQDGIAWYYLLDQRNQRFKLPRTKYGLEGLRTNAGDDIAESLPNITGTSSNLVGRKLVNPTGCITETYYGTDDQWWDGNNAENYILNFDASRSSSTYQDNAPVQERATQMYLYFYVGFYAPSAVEQTAGLNTELFNNKADKTDFYEINPMILTFSNGTSGYNIWANGYCEQWGQVSVDDDSNVTVTFLKTFKDTNYIATAGSVDVQLGSANFRYISFSNLTTTTVTCAGQSNCGSPCVAYWLVKGYLAEGQY